MAIPSATAALSLVIPLILTPLVPRGAGCIYKAGKRDYPEKEKEFVFLVYHIHFNDD